MVTFVSIKKKVGVGACRFGGMGHHRVDRTVSCCSVNQLLREHSEQTAACFLYLPVPPHGDDPTYLQLLTELTADLPPTILVHGVSPVTSTTL
jgi:hypothetical protein